MRTKFYSVWNLTKNRWARSSYDGVNQNENNPFRLSKEEAFRWLERIKARSLRRSLENRLRTRTRAQSSHSITKCRLEVRAHNDPRIAREQHADKYL
jgi:hypothetical protein